MAGQCCNGYRSTPYCPQCGRSLKESLRDLVDFIRLNAVWARQAVDRARGVSAFFATKEPAECRLAVEQGHKPPVPGECDRSWARSETCERRLKYFMAVVDPAVDVPVDVACVSSLREELVRRRCHGDVGMDYMQADSWVSLLDDLLRSASSTLVLAG